MTDTPPNDSKLGFESLQNAAYRRLFEESRSAIYIGTVEGRLLDINPAGLRLFGYASKEEMLQLEMARDLYWNPEDRKRIERLFLRQGFVEDIELELRSQTGQRLRVLESAFPLHDAQGDIIGFRATLQDITQQRKLEEQLRQSQRMEAVGRLTGGVAHDFNNLLTAINGYSELALARMADDEPLRSSLAEIRKAGKRAAELTRRLLTLSRQGMVSPRRLDLNRAVTDMDKLLRRVLGDDIELSTTLDPNLDAVYADQGQIEQMILNLAVNAREAMPRGGQLELISRNVLLPGHEVEPIPEGVEGKFVLLAVHDSGVGMPEEVQEQVFEPFFTTKGDDHNTGLGLSVVQGIVQQNQGHIAIRSEPDQGSRFHLFFPILEPEAPPETERPTPQGELPPGNGTILLVEDDTGVRALVQQILELQGYRVLAAAHAAQAEAILDEFPGHLDLLLTDVVMPEKSGPELAQELELRLPGLKILFMSGYTDSHNGVRMVTERKAAFIAKPFTPEVLARRVRDVLGSKAPS